MLSEAPYTHVCKSSRDIRPSKHISTQPTLFIQIHTSVRYTDISIYILTYLCIHTYTYVYIWIYVCKCIHISIHIYICICIYMKMSSYTCMDIAWACVWAHMGWLRLVGSLKLQVSFAEYRLFSIILRSLLIVATPYQQRIKQVKNRRRRKMRQYLLLVIQDNKGSFHSLHLLLTATHCNTLQHTATHCNTLQHVVYTYGTDSICYSVDHSATHLSRWTSPGNTKVLKGLAVYPRQSLCKGLLPQVARVRAGHPLLEGLLPHIARIRARATACGPPRLLRRWCCVWRPRRCLHYTDDALHRRCIPSLRIPAARAWSAAKCDRLQQTATDFNRLQQTATDCNTLCIPAARASSAAMCHKQQLTATHCNTLQYTATHCVYQQHEHHQLLSATDYNRLQQTATRCVFLRHGQ